MNLKEPLVSIVVPIYNVQDFVEKCIKSILKQTFQDFELLLVNDGSTDNSIKVCKQYMHKDERIRILNKENGGLSDARNYGIDRAKSDYVVFVDGDDYVDERFIEELYKSITNEKSEIAICGYIGVTNDGEMINEVSLNEPNNLSFITGKELLRYSYKPRGVVNEVAWNKIYKKEVFDGVRFTKGKYYEDSYILASLYWNIKKISLVKENLYFYVQRSGSITNSAISKKKVMDANELRLNRINFFYSKDRELYLLAVDEYLYWIAGVVAEIYQDNEFKDIIEYLQRQFRKYSLRSKKTSLKKKVRTIIGMMNIIWLGQIVKFKLNI
ncbi:glycosyl transferase [Limosilactobacillus fermentum]|uniref:glycosyltransferase family 2 protein n=1 Tax=Limosilactobacillus fermentum TaxID=1613 RepID=UPI000E095E5F|nr:glycosyltransferase family 2 protein [Limosilactobacillus fermentum]MDC6078319.1 glycosyltransferase family 2 protein [Limosilactobacillus fermentum]RDG02051.1 glycosyl transferase [Limosilactobacillus fermentum]RDG14796.1 glycosyl transferase [Limosilactobacillus fermentum]WEB67091.1 glycosyltransferase family 2 protein [Limosilactobacillus fermentum]